MRKSSFVVLLVCAVAPAAMADTLSDVIEIGRKVVDATGLTHGNNIPSIGQGQSPGADAGAKRGGAGTLEQGFAGIASCAVRDHFYDASTQPATVPAFLRKTGGKPSTVNETANFRVTDTFYGLPVSEVRLTYSDMQKYGVVFNASAKVVQAEFADRHGGKFDLTAKLRDGSVRKLEDMPGGKSYLSCWYPMRD